LRLVIGIKSCSFYADPIKVMAVSSRLGFSSDKQDQAEHPVTSPAPERELGEPRVVPRWRPGVRLILILVVLLPTVTTVILAGSQAASAWTFRQHAQSVARDSADLEVIASARAQLNVVEVPLSAVSYAAQLGISESVLDKLLKPAVPFQTQLAQATRKMAAFPTFSSTAKMRSDISALQKMIPEVQTRTLAFDQVNAFLTSMADDIDNLWYQSYNQLQSAIAAWQPPGLVEVHASALYQTYQAFLAGGRQIEGAIYVLEGTGPPDAKQELVEATGEFQTATIEFTGHLSPEAQKAWEELRADPSDRHFAATIQQAVNVTLNNLPPPFLGNLSFAGSSMRPGLQYLADLNKLVVAASQDLRNTALTQGSQAASRFAETLIFLALLCMACFGGVIGAGRVLTRPLQRLAKAAFQVHRGEFDLKRLSNKGPKEVVATTSAFNDMADTLKAVEAKTVALATEDLSNPELLVPLPGRTGRALQSTIDALSARIRERELHRQLLHEAATHDRLTGLFNRAAIFDYLTTDVSRRRYQGETVEVLFIDLDGLKPLNDTYGHEIGDAAIAATAEALMEATDPCDVVGRLGGDEFLVVLCHDHSCDGDAVVERIKHSLQQRNLPVDGVQVPLRASVGVALTQCDADTDPMQLVHQADQAMYEAKKAARAARESVATINS
jgi:diguanylate cyclase (GGDEF)-like protein